MQSYFNDITKIISHSLKKNEQFTVWFSAEVLDFARFNNAKIRQAGTVNQVYVEIDLINQHKHSCLNLGLSHNLAQDKKKITRGLNVLREQIARAPEDPYFLINQHNQSSSFVGEDVLLPKEEIVSDVLRQAHGLDLVGCYYGGPIFKGFANSFGQKNWYQKSSFLIDTSVYHSGDKAVKQNYADVFYDKDVFKEKLNAAKMALELFSKPSKTIAKGNYRVYFSPHAVYEILSMLNWGGLSEKSLRVKNSPLLSLATKEKALSEKFSLFENTAAGIGPNFQEQGFVKPDKIDLIIQGQLVSSLISPKTAKEYGIEHNSAKEEENACAMEMAAGVLEKKNILSTLNNGLYINNLWYLNYSNRQNGRITGMTRFFCYEVENGRPTSSFNVMRFDDSIYRIFGENLLAVTKEREFIIDSGTYEERSTDCAILPGIIAEDVRFTL